MISRKTNNRMTFRALVFRQSESKNSSERCYLYREGGATYELETRKQSNLLKLEK